MFNNFKAFDKLLKIWLHVVGFSRCGNISYDFNALHAFDLILKISQPFIEFQIFCNTLQDFNDFM